ncbi:hypothetical protein PoB_007692400 [Plakobranchus ocellatus]|uniref:Uncharacterized protein n=1 Tax=Plakobranchus ocellatus TaxID=259542 RepID=A0AAV4E298_9GAST|nr:hypothetical protein PoB_007692400 [Plakobranchus ocellatus]
MPSSRHDFSVCIVSNPGSGISTSAVSFRLQGGAAIINSFYHFRAAPQENRTRVHAYLEAVLNETDPGTRYEVKLKF